MGETGFIRLRWPNQVHCFWLERRPGMPLALVFTESRLFIWAYWFWGAEVLHLRLGGKGLFDLRLKVLGSQGRKSRKEPRGRN